MKLGLYISTLALGLGLAAGCNSGELEQCLDREQKTAQQLKTLSEEAEKGVPAAEFYKETQSLRLALEKMTITHEQNLRLIDQLNTKYGALLKAQELNCQARLREQETSFRGMVYGVSNTTYSYGGGPL